MKAQERPTTKKGAASAAPASALAHAARTTKVKYTVSQFDLDNPDTSTVGLRLLDVATCLAVLQDLLAGALDLNYSGIGEAVGMTTKDLEEQLESLAIEIAGQKIAEAREALQDLFRQVELKPSLRSVGVTS